MRGWAHCGCLVEIQLRTIHPNPGPRRGRRAEKTDEQSRQKMDRKYQKRRDKRERESGTNFRQGMIRPKRLEGEMEVVTWNLQGVSSRERNRVRLKRTIKFMEKMAWEIVLITELRAEQQGIIWLGEEPNQVAVIHSERSGIVLRGMAIDQWQKDKQWRRFSERTTAVRLGDVKVVAVYQPQRSAGQETVEEFRRSLEDLVVCSPKNEILIIGGDFNAHIGSDVRRDGVCGSFGLEDTNAAGEDFINWCEETGLAYANSFSDHPNRGTWYHRPLRRWFELDGFLLKGWQRPRVLKSINTVNELSFSDHKPKRMVARTKGNRSWRHERETRVPQINWERLKDNIIRDRYEAGTRQRYEEERQGFEDDGRNYQRITKILTETAQEICGTKRREIDNPWTLGHEEELSQRHSAISNLVERRNEESSRIVTRANRERHEQELNRIRVELKNTRKELKRSLKRWERSWWNERIEECTDAQERGDIGAMYSTLRKLGTRDGKSAGGGINITKDEFKNHFASISDTRFESSPEAVRELTDRVGDLRNSEMAVEANELMNQIPDDEEIKAALSDMRDSAPGSDGVRRCYIAEACGDLRNDVYKVVRFLFSNRADRWEGSLKTGHMVPLFKKGDRNNKENYRGICLLAMGSRLLARVVARRLRWWSEHLGVVDENQCGLRPGRSTADATQIIIRIQEDATDLRRRREREGLDAIENEEEQPVARLLDLRKAYPRVNKPILWEILRKYSLDGDFLDTITDLHETTAYRVKGGGGVSEPWYPERGLREGCPTSPALFNVYHQAAMRQAEENRKELAETNGKTVGIEWKWLPGNCFPGQNLWEKPNSEAQPFHISSSLFADDTTILGTADEMEEGVAEIKRVMGLFEERNNDDKEETLRFGCEESEDVRMLGCWVGPDNDTRNRIRRSGFIWSKVKRQLRGSKLSRRTQAKIFEACVESALLFDCQVRTWYKKDFRKLQSWVDRCYRYIWCNKTQPPLRQMHMEHKNMQDVRNILDIRSVQWKIEKRVLERIGHVMRMPNTRTTKKAALGWMSELERWNKCPGRKRKLVLYWKRVMTEAGMDWSDVELLTADRAEWRAKIKIRMDHLREWEQQRAHAMDDLPEEERVQRSGNRDDRDSLRCGWPGCGKLCRSKGGLAIHRKRMHGVNREEENFVCGKCRMTFRTENTRINHEKTCGGAGARDDDMRRCEKCGREISKTNIARHRRACTAGEGEGGARGEVRQELAVGGRKYIPKYAPCPRCGRELSATNMARHLKTCRGRR